MKKLLFITLLIVSCKKDAVQPIAKTPTFLTGTTWVDGTIKITSFSEDTMFRVFFGTQYVYAYTLTKDSMISLRHWRTDNLPTPSDTMILHYYVKISHDSLGMCLNKSDDLNAGFEGIKK